MWFATQLSELLKKSEKPANKKPAVTLLIGLGPEVQRLRADDRAAGSLCASSYYSKRGKLQKHLTDFRMCVNKVSCYREAVQLGSMYNLQPHKTKTTCNFNSTQQYKYVKYYVAKSEDRVLLLRMKENRFVVYSETETVHIFKFHLIVFCFKLSEIKFALLNSLQYSSKDMFYKR